MCCTGVYFTLNLKVCTCNSSPTTACTWSLRVVQPWSTRSTPDARGENTSVFCKCFKNAFDPFFWHVSLCLTLYFKALPAPPNHALWNWSQYPLHHGEMLLIVVSLLANTNAHNRAGLMRSPCRQRGGSVHTRVSPGTA